LAAENTTLDCSAIGDGLVGVDATVGFLAVEEFLYELLDFGDTGGATNEYDFVDFRFFET